MYKICLKQENQKKEYVQEFVNSIKSKNPKTPKLEDTNQDKHVVKYVIFGLIIMDVS